MLPEEKANELISKFKKYVYADLISVDVEGDWNTATFDTTPNAKQCALIICNEIIDVLGGEGVYSFADDKVSEYWEQVKKSIEEKH